MVDDNGSFRVNPSNRTLHVLKGHGRALARHGLVISGVGLLAILVPEVATVAIELAVGWLFVALGAFRLFVLLRLPSYPGRNQSLITAGLALLLGLVLLFHPFAGALTLTMALLLFFIAEGLVVTLVAMMLKPYLRSWPIILASGLFDLVLAAAVLAGWPGTADWAIGLMVGLNLLSLGISLVLLGRGVQRLS